MLLQSSFASLPHCSSSSSSSNRSSSQSALSSHLAYAPSPPSTAHNFTRLPTYIHRMKNHHHISCSISMVHTYNTTDFEKRPAQKWNVTYRKISLMENHSDSEASVSSVLDKAVSEGKKFTKWELSRIVKELRKYRRFRLALQVCAWMNNKGEKYRLTASDVAIQLDLVSKVQGIPNAEDFFQKLPDTVKDNRVYGSLLNAYTQARMKEKAEALMDDMRNKGYASHPLPFNVMMTLYMNLKEYDKVDAMAAEMVQKKIQLDIYTYNIWLSSCGSEGSLEKMEQVLEQMKTDRSINPNWTTYSTIATMYTRRGQIEKAEECLRLVESKIAGRDRIPYHYLISLYGSVGNKDELFRIWNIYKATFPTIPNMGYHAMISSLVRIGDITGAEEMHQQWLRVKATYDPRIPNLLMQWHVRNRQLIKATEYLNQMTKAGGVPNSSSWEILAEGYIGERRIPEALSCLKEAFNAVGAKNWKPKPPLLTAFINLCDEEADTASKDALVELLKQKGHLGKEAYKSGGLNDELSSGNESVTVHEDESSDFQSRLLEEASQ